MQAIQTFADVEMGSVIENRMPQQTEISLCDFWNMYV